MALGRPASGPAWSLAFTGGAQPGAGPYGSLDGRSPDASGLILPEGFTSRVLARSDSAVEGTEYVWHRSPDGGATFALDDGGWTYVSNSEVPLTGGVGALRFDPDGEVVDAYAVLSDTTINCAGGPTPWGTWLSCEEFDLHDEPEAAAASASIAGQVWECDPSRAGQGEVRPAMGKFQHEAAAVDPAHECVYLTEDQPDGLLYRFTPAAYPDLSEGVLEAAVLEGGTDGGATVRWIEVPDPSAADVATRRQLPDATRFPGGEGLWFHDGTLYVTTKYDGRVHAIDTTTDVHDLVYDPAAITDPPLSGVDNIVVEAGSGDLYVAEDGDNMEICVITPDGEVAPVVRVVGHDDSEVTGPAFSPDGTRLYFSSQRGEAGTGLGVTYEVTGPFRGATPEPTTATSAPTERGAADSAAGGAADEGDGLPLAIGLGGAAVLAGGGAVLALRRRRSR